MSILKKIFAALSAFPMISNLLKKSAQTGRIDPQEALSALSSISSDTKKCADVAIQTANNGGSIPDVAKALSNIGELEVMGKKINTHTMIDDLKRTGGICEMLGKMLEKMQTQSPEEINEFGKHATNLDNWADFIKN